MTIDRVSVLPRIYGEVASGRSLDRVLSDDEGMPSPSTFWRWHMEDDEIRDNLARARDNGVEVHMDEIVTIADDLTEDPASRRVRIDARTKRAQMIAPRKYGAKIDVTSAGESVKMDDVAQLTRLAALASKLQKRTDDAADDPS